MQRSLILSRCTVLTLAACAAMSLTACGGGGGGGSGSSGNPPAATGSLNGVAATGAPLANATVTVTDSAGKTCTGTTQNDGSYRIDLAQCSSAPYLIKAVGSAADGTSVAVSSVAVQSGVANITPLTDLISRRVLGTALDKSKLGSTVTPTTVQAAQNELKQALASTLTALGLNANQVDFLGGSFAADHTGLDKLLDSTTLTVKGSGDVVLVAKDTGSVAVTVPGNGGSLAAGSQPTLLEVDAGIDTLVSSLQTALASYNTSAIRSLLTDDFMQSGENADQWAADVSDKSGNHFAGLALGKPYIGNCLQASAGACQAREVIIPLTTTNGRDSLSTSVRKINGSWKLVGNLLPVDLELVPAAQRDAAGGITSGLKLSGDVYSPLIASISRADVTVSTLSATPTVVFTSRWSDCQRGWLCAPNLQGNFQPINTPVLSLDGSRYLVRVTLSYKNQNGVSTTLTYQHYLKSPTTAASTESFPTLNGTPQATGSAGQYLVKTTLPASVLLGDVSLFGSDASGTSWMANSSMNSATQTLLTFKQNDQPVAITRLTSAVLSTDSVNGWKLTSLFNF